LALDFYTPRIYNGSIGIRKRQRRVKPMQIRMEVNGFVFWTERGVDPVNPRAGEVFETDFSMDTIVGLNSKGQKFRAGVTHPNDENQVRRVAEFWATSGLI
jgi:hypothetical protein